MKLFFNGVALHELGVVVLRGENRTMVGGTEAPDGVEVRLSFGVEVVDRTYALCRARVEQVQLALRAGRGALVWMEAVTDRVMLSREVAVEGPNGPAEPNSDGRRHQVVEFSVAYSEGLAPVAGRGLRCTWTKTGAALVDLGEVSAWEPSYSADRYSPLRAHRSGAAGSVVVKGRMWPAAGLDEGARRAWLAGRATAIAAAMNSKDGTLRVWNEGAAVTELMNRVVRVVSWKPEVKQGSESLGWELTAVYSEFPNESSYAVSEFRVRRERDARTQGVVLTVSGRVGSNSEAACRAKWATILAGVVPGGAVAVPESESAETQQIAADVDGETLLEMAFSNSYRLTDGSVGAHELRLSDVEDVGSGMIRRAVSGQVTATGATWAAAYEAAVGRARVLGEGQGAMLRSSSISVARQNGPAPVAGPTAYSVTVEFAFEFQLRGNRIWMEVRGEVVRDAFGGFGEAVSGSLVAGTEAAAEAELEAWLAAGYAGRMVKQKRVSKGRVELRTGRTANPGSVRTPPDSGSWGVGVNAGEYGVGGGGVGQFVRLDFSLELGLDRTTGQDIAVRHGAEVNKSWRTLERTTRISGVVYAQNEGDAEWAVGVVLGLYSGLGALVEESGSGEREKVLGVRSTGGDDVPVSTGGVENQRGYLVAYQFSRVYVGRLTAADMILECSVSESISHSGVNWVVQPTAYGRPQMQACGYTAGGRVVRASAVAPTEAYAREWVRRYYSLVFPAGMAVPGTRYRKGPEFTVTPRMAPLTDGVFRTDGPATANALVYEVAGSFEEVLVSADYVP